ncbi:transcription initiation factor TFIID subunit 2-like isoform X1 [Tripterygium wilfordii]|uniref:transcription initiation factor TFIID subunit 2-like isoform X1 n=1 Tax=Tripterygium wilfordii TaxID=458696 RepID=UPI0018F835E8|nr:transcription initiation factor TFIID subunit 2-like isoform X1 [Tripterygium wilfordii]
MSYQINQLGKDQDVVAQTQAIAALEVQSQISFSIVNALNNILCDSKALWRVRSRHCLHWLTLHLRWGIGQYHLDAFYLLKKTNTDTSILGLASGG